MIHENEQALTDARELAALNETTRYSSESQAERVALHIYRLVAENEDARRQIEKLQDGLRPFAKAKLQLASTDEQIAFGVVMVSAADHRRAIDLLRGKLGDDQPILCAMCERPVEDSPWTCCNVQDGKDAHAFCKRCVDKLNNSRMGLNCPFCDVSLVT